MINSDTMIEAPERTGISGITEVVKLRRFIKELSRVEDIALGGVRGQRLDGILDHTDQVLSQLQDEHRDWIEQKRELFADYLSPVKPDVMEKAYRSGLAITITQEFRTYSRVSKDETVKLDDPEYLRGVITGYTVDFFHSLRLSEGLGINPDTALEVARLSYRYNPTKLILLIRDAEFEGLTQSAIEHAARNYKNPDAFLKGFIIAVAELKANPEFKGLTQNTIEYAALNNPKNPDLFLKGFIIAVAKLTENYPDILKSTILRAALYFSDNPDEYIEQVKAGKVPAEVSEAE